MAAGVALVFLSSLLLWAATDRGKASDEPAGSVASPTTAAPASSAAVALPAAALVPPAPPTQRPFGGVSEPVVDPLAQGSGSSLLPAKPGEIQRITTLADGAPEIVLTYLEAGQKTIYISVPPNWEPSSARLDVSAEAHAVTQIDQKNEASMYEGTWGVRAQQFRPVGNVLTSVELFLARTSSKPASLTVEIRTDDGRGYPSARVLTSVSRHVTVGAYRWEKFDLPEVSLEPGQPYWIVNYVRALNEAAYPATPSVGDYGYYLGMSLGDEYARGESADFLAFSTGSRWEKLAGRKAWDLMFRIISLFQHVPTGPRLDVGADGDTQWSRPAEFEGTEATEDFSSELAEYLRARPATTEENIVIPITIKSDSPGVIRISNIQITGWRRQA